MEKPEPYAITDEVWMVPCRILNNEDYQPICRPFTKLNLTKFSQRYAWDREEEKFLVSLIQNHGQKNWSRIAKNLNNKFHKGVAVIKGKQCRERWLNHLNPSLQKVKWSADEDLLLLSKQQVLGNHWSEIAKFLYGRTENQVKNRWKSLIKKKQKLEKEISKGFHEEMIMKMMPTHDSSNIATFFREAAENLFCPAKVDDSALTLPDDYDPHSSFTPIKQEQDSHLTVNDEELTLRLSSLTSNIEEFARNEFYNTYQQPHIIDFESMLIQRAEIDKTEFDQCLANYLVNAEANYCIPSPSNNLTSQWIKEDMEKVVEFMQATSKQRTFQGFLFENGFKQVEAYENAIAIDNSAKIPQFKTNKSLRVNIPKNSNISDKSSEN